MSMDRRSSPVKRWAVKWDETEIPDGEYVSAADYDALVAKTNARVQELQDMNLRFGARIRELEAKLAQASSSANSAFVNGHRIRELEAQSDGAAQRIRELERLVHLACNHFENITVATTLEIAHDQAHRGVSLTSGSERGSA
jgi:multidrug resistance efflux pump